jgi:membrane-associated phospholipid phosphatase
VRHLGRAGGRPLLPPGLRGPAVALVCACLVIIAILGAWLAHRAQPGSVDGRTDDWLIAHVHSGRGMLKAVGSLGNTNWAVLVFGLLVLTCAVTRRYRGALLVVIAAPVAGAVSEYVLKPLFDRTISGYLAFPSGHLTAVSTMAVALVVLLTGPARWPLPAPLRWLLAATALAAVPAAAISVVIDQYHYFTDTVGGTAVGTATVLATALVVDGAFARRGRRAAADDDPAARDGISAAAPGLPRV